MKSCTGGVDAIHWYFCGELQRCQSEAAIPDSRLARRPDVCRSVPSLRVPARPPTSTFSTTQEHVCVCVWICDTMKAFLQLFHLSDYLSFCFESLCAVQRGACADGSLTFCNLLD